MRRTLKSHRQCERKQLHEIRIPRGSKFEVQRDFKQKYPDYEGYIAAGSNIDLVADTDGDQVPSDGYNDGRAHITVVIFLQKRVSPQSTGYELA